MKGDIDAGKRDRSKTTLKDDIAFGLLFFKCAVEAAVNDILQHLLNLRETKFLGQLKINHKYNSI